MKKLFLIFCLGFCQTIFAQSSVNETKVDVTILNTLFAEEQISSIERILSSNFYHVRTRNYGEGVIGTNGKWLIELGEADIDITFTTISCWKEADNYCFFKCFNLIDGSELFNIKLKRDGGGFEEESEALLLETQNRLIKLLTGLKELPTYYTFYPDSEDKESGFSKDGYIRLINNNDGNYAIAKGGKIFYYPSDLDYGYLGNDLFIKEGRKIFTFNEMCAFSSKP